jgi:hypothetical protein
MGTETGPYVSFDDGASWSDLALEMPVAAITDLIVHPRDNDLVAATAGRSFWILDDLSPLQQLDPRGAGALALYRPEPAVRSANGGFGGGARPRFGRNPPGPSTLDFVLPELPAAAPGAGAGDGDGAGGSEEPAIVIEIRDAGGELVRRFEGKPKPEPPGGGAGAVGLEQAPAGEGAGGGTGEAAEVESARKSPKNALEQAADAQITRFEVERGHNRVAWDLRHQQVLPIPGRFVFGTLAGRRVVPGTYAVTLRVAGREVGTELRVEPDPRVSATPDDYRAQEELMRALDGQLDEIHRTTLRVQAVRDQVERFLASAKNHDEADAIGEAGRELIEELTAVEEALVQKRTVDGQTVINFEPQLDFHFVYLRNAVEASEGVVTQGQRERLRDLTALWAEQRSRSEAVLGERLDRFNALVREKDVPTVLVP